MKKSNKMDAIKKKIKSMPMDKNPVDSAFEEWNEKGAMGKYGKGKNKKMKGKC